MKKNPYLKNEKQDVEDIEMSLLLFMHYIEDVQGAIWDYKDKADDLNDEDTEIEISNIKETYKGILREILEKANLELAFWNLSMNERIK